MPILVSYSRLHRVVLFTGGLLFAGAAVLAVFYDIQPETRPITVILGLLMGLPGLYLALKPPTVATLDANGISVPRLGPGLIPWSAVQRAWFRRRLGAPHLCLQLAPGVDKATYAAIITKRPAFTRDRAAWGDVVVHCEGFSPSARELVLLIHDRFLARAA